MKKKHRLLLLGVCLAALLGTMLETRAQAEPEPPEPLQFGVELVFGFDGAAKEYDTIPVTLEIHNQGEAFEGSVKMTSGPRDSFSHYYDFEAQLVIGAGEQRSVRFYLPQDSVSYEASVEFLAANGASVQSDQYLGNISYSSMLIGVLSDDYSAAGYLGEMRWLDRSHSLANPQPVNLAKSLEYLDYDSINLLDVIVINDFRTDQLTRRQAGLIKGWVEQGGTLLVGTGVHYQRTLSGFIDDYIGGSIGAIGPRSGFLGAQDTYNIAGEDSLELDVVELRIDGAAARPDEWYQTVSKGRGNIAVFQFDLAGKSLLGWSYRNQALEQIFSDILFNKTGTGGSSGHQLSARQVGNTISNVYINSIPSISRYILVLLVYVALLPILYMVLKKRDKRHYIWGAVPALSIVFALVIYITGTGSRLKNPNLNYLCVLNLNDSVARESVYMGSTSPRNSPYEFSVGEEYNLSLSTDYYYGYSYGRTQSSVTLKQGPAFRTAAITNSAAFDTKYFLAERYNDSLGELSLQMEYRQDGHHFTLANRSALSIETAGVVVPGLGVIPIEALEPGETLELDEDGILPAFSGYNYANFADDHAAELICADGSGSEERVASRRNQLRSMIDGMGSGIYLIGFTGDYAPDLGENPKLDVAGDTMVIRFAKEAAGSLRSYIADIGQYEVFDDEAPEEEDDYDRTYRAFRFGELTVEALTLSGDSWEYVEAVALFNHQTETYDHVFLDGTTFAELEPYLSEDGLLWVRYEDYFYYGDLPVISAVVARQ